MAQDVDVAEVAKWAAGMAEVQARIAPRFARSEPRERVVEYVQGLLSPLERKNGWTLAEHAGDARPDGKQRLLYAADWDADGVRDDLRDYVAEHLWCPDGVLVLDETGFLEEGRQVRRGGAAVLGHRGADRERPGRGVPFLCGPPRTSAGGPGALPAQRVGGRPAAAPRSRHP